jgi:nicotinamidase-related amidase
MGHALLIVDIQNDYFPGGRMELEGAEAAAARAAVLLSRFRDAGRPVIHVQHVSNRPGATFFLPDTPGVEIHEAVRPRAGETVIVKHFPNSFRDTPLADRLRSRDIGELTLAGMMTHMCIDTTVRAAFDLGLRCTLAHDACATRALAFGKETIPAHEVHRSFIAALHGLFAQARTVDEIVAAG